MASKTCFLCSGPITGDFTQVWAQSPAGGRMSWHPAHHDCAKMLEDDEDSDDELEEEENDESSEEPFEEELTKSKGE